MRRCCGRLPALRAWGAGPLGATLPTLTAAAFGVEWLLSFALMFVIMAVATDRRVADGLPRSPSGSR